MGVARADFADQATPFVQQRTAFTVTPKVAGTNEYGVFLCLCQIKRLHCPQFSVGW